MEAPYVPDLGINYPEQPDGHMIDVNPMRDVIVDENYPFIDKSLGFKLYRFWTYLLINTAAFFLCFLRYGLKIQGRKNLRKYKKLLKNGAMTVSNHVQRWDFIFVALAVRIRWMFFPIWKEHLKGRDARWIKHAGGIPIPSDIHTMRAFNNAFDEIHAKKIWIHAYPESTRFDYYVPIRPFKKGVFSMAHRYNLPIIPIAISYRKSHFPFTIVNFLRAVKGDKKLPLITISIGEPILFDEKLGRKEAVLKARKECHEAMVRLAGITDNPWQAEGD
ncbi:MAG: 1-acyl-sn-glycerol-3-phosphate acyltransferase [Treponema sp.]|nr:1-acyl-sn-glycerol-3-phosphate acyltransferase [Treponema sp.]